MITFRSLLIPIFILGIAACDPVEIDDEKPVIDLSLADAFPVNCDTLYLGEPFTLVALFTDNVELGAFSFDIHHNFDQHTHSTEVNNCEMDPKKEPVNPLLVIEDFSIPPGSTEYLAEVEITLPLSNGQGEFDKGDYHFFLSLTDKEGWSTQKGLSIKILKRP